MSTVHALPSSDTGLLIAALVARMIEDTEKFNQQVTKVPVPTNPKVLTIARQAWANTAFLEEMQEFNKACDDGDVLEAADAMIDLAFFALGRLGEMGVPATAVWEGVVQANLAKQQGALAKRPGSEGHDAIKPEGWTPPDHSWLFHFSLADIARARAYDKMSPVFKRITELRENKGGDYNNVPGGRDAYFPFGHASYAHMVNTKALRIQSLVNNAMTGKKVKFESLADSLEDLINYVTFYIEAMEDGRLKGLEAAA